MMIEMNTCKNMIFSHTTTYFAQAKAIKLKF